MLYFGYDMQQHLVFNVVTSHLQRCNYVRLSIMIAMGY